MGISQCCAVLSRLPLVRSWWNQDRGATASPARPRGLEQLSASRKTNIKTLRKSEVRASFPILLRPPGPILFLSASFGRAAKLCRVSL